MFQQRSSNNLVLPSLEPRNAYGGYQNDMQTEDYAGVDAFLNNSFRQEVQGQGMEDFSLEDDKFNSSSSPIDYACAEFDYCTSTATSATARISSPLRDSQETFMSQNANVVRGEGNIFLSEGVSMSEDPHTTLAQMQHNVIAKGDIPREEKQSPSFDPRRVLPYSPQDPISQLSFSETQSLFMALTSWQRSLFVRKYLGMRRWGQIYKRYPLISVPAKWAPHPHNPRTDRNESEELFNRSLFHQNDGWRRLSWEVIANGLDKPCNSTYKLVEEACNRYQKSAWQPQHSSNPGWLFCPLGVITFQHLRYDLARYAKNPDQVRAQFLEDYIEMSNWEEFGLQLEKDRLFVWQLFRTSCMSKMWNKIGEEIHIAMRNIETLFFTRSHEDPRAESPYSSFPSITRQKWKLTVRVDPGRVTGLSKKYLRVLDQIHSWHVYTDDHLVFYTEEDESVGQPEHRTDGEQEGNEGQIPQTDAENNLIDEIDEGYVNNHNPGRQGQRQSLRERSLSLSLSSESPILPTAETIIEHYDQPYPGISKSLLHDSNYLEFKQDRNRQMYLAEEMKRQVRDKKVKRAQQLYRSKREFQAIDKEMNGGNSHDVEIDKGKDGECDDVDDTHAINDDDDDDDDDGEETLSKAPSPPGHHPPDYRLGNLPDSSKKSRKAPSRKSYSGENEAKTPSPPKRPRGRPPKSGKGLEKNASREVATRDGHNENNQEISSALTPPAQKRSRGRPRGSGKKAKSVPINCSTSAPEVATSGQNDNMANPASINSSFRD